MEKSVATNGSLWLQRYLTNGITKKYQFKSSSNIEICYEEVMSEVKLCTSAAVLYIQLCKADDARKMSNFIENPLF